MPRVLTSLLTLLAIACAGGDKDNSGATDEVGNTNADGDHDGFFGEEDCNEAAPDIHVGAPELCDGIDNNCDGAIDEGVTTTYYVDADGDGFGDDSASTESCSAVDGYVTNNSDCDDADEDVYPSAMEACDGVDNDCDGAIDEDGTTTWYADADGDGFGDDGTATSACAAIEGYVVVGGDCNDDAAAAFPGATEICDELDNDCNGAVDEGVTHTYYEDRDGDAYGVLDRTAEACVVPAGYAVDSGDCDDEDSAFHPGAREDDCTDPNDYNCDGSVVYADADLDSFAACVDCDDTNPDRNPLAVEICNSLDDDCDGYTDDVDPDVDLSTGTTFYEDDDTDTFGDPLDSLLACAAPAGYVTNAADCDDTDFDIKPTATEVCDDVDNDCDVLIDDADSSLDLTTATTWYRDADTDAYGNSAASTRTCDRPTGYVAVGGDCDDTQVTVNPGATEICNSIDDDCDALTDDADPSVTGAPTWHRDADADTYGDPAVSSTVCISPTGYVSDNTDCDDTDATVYPGAPETWYDGVDSDCDGAEDPSACDGLPGEVNVGYDASCAYGYSTSGWSIGTLWTTDGDLFATGSTYTHVMMTPVIGNLNDDNGNGVIDDEDIPDVVVNMFAGSAYSSYGYLRAFSGDDGSIEFTTYRVYSGGTYYYPGGSAGIALGDVDGDGTPEIATATTSGDLLLLSNTGALKWVNTAVTISAYAMPTIADLNGDGSAEIVAGPYIVSASGALLGTCAAGSTRGPSVVADIDLDGTMEVVLGSMVCSRTGTTKWSSSRTAGYPAVGNFDSDAYLEVVNSDPNNNRIDLLDHNGTLLWSYNLSAGNGPPAVSDFDGDGSTEVVVAGANYITMLETNGTLKWRVAISDTSSQSAGASAFDFDGDGDSEVLYADEVGFYIFDGATGTALYSNTSHASGTIHEFPVVADINRDGHAEVVLASNDYAFTGWDGVRALYEKNGLWASARTVYNQVAYDVDECEEDLSIPTVASTSGQTRTQHAWSDLPDGAADVEPYLVGVCEDCSLSTIDVYVAMQNNGAVFVPDGTSIAVYALNGTTKTLLSTQYTTAPADPGERQAPLTFTIARSAVGADGLYIAADIADDVVECDESNNALTWDALTCP